MLVALSGTFWENIGLMPFHLPSPHCCEVYQGGRPGFGLAKAAALLPSSGKSPRLSVRGLVTSWGAGDASRRGSGASKATVLTDRPDVQVCGKPLSRAPRVGIECPIDDRAASSRASATLHCECLWDGPGHRGPGIPGGVVPPNCVGEGQRGRDSRATGGAAAAGGKQETVPAGRVRSAGRRGSVRREGSKLCAPGCK